MIYDSIVLLYTTRTYVSFYLWTRFTAKKFYYIMRGVRPVREGKTNWSRKL